MTQIINYEAGDALLTWGKVTDAIAQGHSFPRADIGDTFLRRGPDTLLSRSAWIDGLGMLTKTATVIPANTPSIDGGVMLFGDQSGQLEAVIDFKLLTKWKTVGDSLLAAKLLAHDHVTRILVLGAGTVAGQLIDAFRTEWPDAEYVIWNHNPAKADALAKSKECVHATRLPKAVEGADIILGATMTIDPVLRGEWITPGTHVNLVGAYRADMREADDEVLRRSKIYVDSRATTLDHIGEMKIPLAKGVITPDDIKADYYDLPNGAFKRGTATDITLFKNGGGAHLDLMVARAIFEAM
ncbi:MAG: ornithine cyclodeaminase [Pseudomonadota bacterium]